MGRKFIDKKKSATFQLLVADTSVPIHQLEQSADRVLVRVDNNLYDVQGLGHGESADSYDEVSIFADAPEDEKEAYVTKSHVSSDLADHVRRELLELGFPDDGYNYLVHLKDVRSAGSGSVVHHNSKARLDQLPLDIKAYDASRVEINEIHEDPNLNPTLSVAAETVGIRVQKAVNSDVIAMLNEDDLSNLGSVVEDLEEDFVFQANLLDGDGRMVSEVRNEVWQSNSNTSQIDGNQSVVPRVWRGLDEQFELVERNEYGTDSQHEHSEYLSEDDSGREKAFVLNGETIGSVLPGKEQVEMIEDPRPAPDVIRRCFEYAEKYENENDSETPDDSYESSDESESWDCETIISTYSNLDNHPGKIEPPGFNRKKLAEKLSRALNITEKLQGNGNISTGILKRQSKEKKSSRSSRDEHNRRERHGRESKEAKNERKATVKHDRREARRAKKEMKEVYKCETQRAQRIAATSGPSSIHIS